MKLVYAIRHKPTGFFIPEPGRQQWRKSHVDPVDCSGDNPNPRLFATELAAKRAMSAWVQGKWGAETYWEQDGWESPAYLAQDIPAPTPVPGRNKEDMEVVSFRLELT
jgi:hypothetical protein